jgi:hypothetical protein
LVYEFPGKEITRNALAIIAGVLTIAAFTAVCFFIAAILVVGDDKPPKSQANIASFLMDFGILAGSFVGGYVTASVSARNNYIPVILTGILVLAMIGFLDISDLSSLKKSDILYGLAILFFVLFGGFIILRNRKQPINDLTFDKEDADADKLSFKDNSSSPSDTL